MRGRHDIAEVARKHMSAILSPILVDDALDDPRWRGLSVVFLIAPRGRAISNYGYAYSEREWWAVAFPVERTRGPVLDYLAELEGGEPANLRSVIVQYERETMRVRLRVDRDDPQRWQIGTANARRLIDELRPAFPEVNEIEASA